MYVVHHVLSAHFLFFSAFRSATFHYSSTVQLCFYSLFQNNTETMSWEERDTVLENALELKH